MRCGCFGWSLLIAASVGIIPGVAVAADLPAFPAQAQRTYTLRRCLELARQNYPKIAEEVARLDRSRAQLGEVKAATFSQFNATAGLGVSPRLRGTAVFSPDSDESFTPDLGIGWQMGIEGVIPLWTFGKLSGLADAARAQVELGSHQVDKARREVELAVRRAFYGLQLARDALDLVRSATRRIAEHVARLEVGVSQGTSDEVDLLELKMYHAELEARESEALKQSQIALSSLGFFTGVGGVIDIPDEPLRAVAHRLAPVAQYLTAARLHRPEVNMARAAVMARQAQLRVEEAKYLPDLGLGLSANWSRAPNITDQVNPFAYDRANFVHYGIGIVLRWKLDFLSQRERVAQASAQLEEVRATERFALGGVGVEVEKAFAEAKEAERRLDAYDRAAGYAKQWLIMVQQGIDVGTYEDKDLVEPAKEHALKTFSRLMATFDYNLALAQLALATGWSGVAPE